jgi:hypothetical protein
MGKKFRVTKKWSAKKEKKVFENFGDSESWRRGGALPSERRGGALP